MEIFNILENNVNQRYIDQVVETLKDGGLIIYPTDTVYALGCDALNNQAIERICSIKEMKSAKTNLSIICDDISQVAEFAKFDNVQFRMMKTNLPGPFTFIFTALSSYSAIISGNLRSVSEGFPKVWLALLRGAKDICNYILPTRPLIRPVLVRPS